MVTTFPVQTISRSRLLRLAESAAFCSVLLFALNAWICWRLFFLEYPQYFSSIEGAFISIARYALENWPHISWWPLWHCGMPYQDTYVPLLHLAVAAVAALSGFSAPHAYHLVTALTYSLGPVTLLLLLRGLGATPASAFIAALAYSLFSPSTMLMPAVRMDAGGLFNARRLQVLVEYGEGPHISSIALLPLALLAIHRLLDRMDARRLALAALSIAAVLLTNTPGSVSLVFAICCLMVAQRVWSPPSLLRVMGAGLFAYGIAAYGLPWPTIRTNLANMERMHAGFSYSLIRAGLVLLLLAALAAAGWGLGRLRTSLYVRFGSIYFLAMGSLVLAGLIFSFDIVPQPHRFQLEMEIGIVIVMAAAAAAVFRASPLPARRLLLALGLAAAALQISSYRAHARQKIRAVDPVSRSEYATALWLGENMEGRRVFTSGSTAFWLNVFNDTPQLTGCCDQGMPDRFQRPPIYLITATGSPHQTELSVLWMQAFGVHAVAVGGPESTDSYKDFRFPQKFEGVLDEFHRGAGDVIYRVPQASPMLSHVLRRDEIVWREPTDVEDVGEVRRYVNVLQDVSRPIAAFKWVANNHAKIRAQMARDDLVSVQVTHSDGWQASANGKPARVLRDGLDFIVIEPDCEGACDIDLIWTQSASATASKWISAFSLLLAAGMLVLPRRRSPA